MNSFHHCNTIPIDIRFAETDMAGIFHHSNIFIWFEMGRFHLIKQFVPEWPIVTPTGQVIITPVTKIRTVFMNMARFGDRLHLETFLKPQPTTRLIFYYRLTQVEPGAASLSYQNKVGQNWRGAEGVVTTQQDGAATSRATNNATTRTRRPRHRADDPPAVVMSRRRHHRRRTTTTATTPGGEKKGPIVALGMSEHVPVTQDHHLLFSWPDDILRRAKEFFTEHQYALTDGVDIDAKL